MKRGLRSFVITVIMSCAFIKASAQPHHTDSANSAVLDKYQDSLTSSASALFGATSNIRRFDLNSRFIKMLVTALKTPASFNYSFDSLKTISVVKSPDNAFKIFSWYVPTDEGTYRFFGAVQMATKDGRLKLYPLIEESSNLTADNLVTTNKNWYGARYYEIVPVIMSGRKTAYALLGWKGNNNKTSKKVIDILSFEGDSLHFGKPLFEGPKGAPLAKNRIVFEYSKLNSMTLRLDKNTGMIVFDHLAPVAADMEGNFEYYVSDSSFDGYRLVGDKLRLVENIELKNDPDKQDDFYIDPKQKDTPVTKKF